MPLIGEHLDTRSETLVLSSVVHNVIGHVPVVLAGLRIFEEPKRARSEIKVARSKRRERCRADARRGSDGESRYGNCNRGN